MLRDAALPVAHEDVEPEPDDGIHSSHDRCEGAVGTHAGGAPRSLKRVQRYATVDRRGEHSGGIKNAMTAQQLGGPPHADAARDARGQSHQV